MYSIKETFYTLQGEGAHTGRPAVFCRFSGCNLWSGQEQHRDRAICTFCDTDFRGTNGSGGGKFITPQLLTQHIKTFWPHTTSASPFVVCTGGEPLLQLDPPLIRALHDANFEIAVETNGTIAPPEHINWLTVSPKANTTIVISRCDELKLVYPQNGALPEHFDSVIQARYYYLTPMADPHASDIYALYRGAFTQRAMDYCLKHPKWRLNLQSHKILCIR